MTVSYGKVFSPYFFGSSNRYIGTWARELQTEQGHSEQVRRNYLPNQP